MHMLGPIRREHQRLRTRSYLGAIRTALQQQRPQLTAHWRAAGLTSDDDVTAQMGEMLTKHLDLRAFPDSVNALEGQEQPAHWPDALRDDDLAVPFAAPFAVADVLRAAVFFFAAEPVVAFAPEDRALFGPEVFEDVDFLVPVVDFRAPPRLFTGPVARLGRDIGPVHRFVPGLSGRRSGTDRRGCAHAEHVGDGCPAAGADVSA